MNANVGFISYKRQKSQKQSQPKSAQETRNTLYKHAVFYNVAVFIS